MENKEIKVVGVTFNNDICDGGESRQEILRSLRKSGRRIVDLDLVYTQYNGEPAIKVRERSTKKIIGWMPKDRVAEIMEDKIKHTVGFIAKYEGTENIKIQKPQFPTNVEYHRMKKMCANRGVMMPAYDKRAYKVWEKKVLKGLKTA